MSKASEVLKMLGELEFKVGDKAKVVKTGLPEPLKKYAGKAGEVVNLDKKNNSVSLKIDGKAVDFYVAELEKA